jgi:hypothetical protein
MKSSSGIHAGKNHTQMQTEPNTDLLYFDGYCPECNLKVNSKH